MTIFKSTKVNIFKIIVLKFNVDRVEQFIQSPPYVVNAALKPKNTLNKSYSHRTVGVLEYIQPKSNLGILDLQNKY